MRPCMWRLPVPYTLHVAPHAPGSWSHAARLWGLRPGPVPRGLATRPCSRGACDQALFPGGMHLKPVELLAMLLCALVHGIRHPGINDDVMLE